MSTINVAYANDPAGKQEDFVLDVTILPCETEISLEEFESSYTYDVGGDTIIIPLIVIQTPDCGYQPIFSHFT